MTELMMAPASPAPAALLAEDEISAGTAQLVRAGITWSTENAYAGDWSRFSGWCAQAGRTAMPATSATLTQYVGHLAELGRKPATIKRALASISVCHRRAGAEPPDPEEAQKALTGYRRLRADQGLDNNKKADVLHAADMRQIAAAFGQELAEGAGRAAALRDRAIIFTAYNGMNRREEIAALFISDVEFVGGEGMEITVRRSKTDQDAKGRVTAIPYASDPAACAVLFMRAWIELLAERGITDGPLFRRIDTRGNVDGTPGISLSGRGSADGRLTGKAIWTIVHSAGAAADLRKDIGVPKRAAPHGLRSGGASAARSKGASSLAISRQGGWVDNSTTALGYQEFADRWSQNPMKGVL